MSWPGDIDSTISEKELQTFVLELARGFGWEVYHQVDAVFCPTCHKPTFSKKVGAGFPDLVLAHPNGRLIFAELKSQKGPLREGQPEWLKLLHIGNGREVYLWRPSDMDAIVQILQPAHDATPGETLVLPDRYMDTGTGTDSESP